MHNAVLFYSIRGKMVISMGKLPLYKAVMHTPSKSSHIFIRRLS